MPIKPENAKRYPPRLVWAKIRRAILDRAGHRCERCGVPNGCFVARLYRDKHVWSACATLTDANAERRDWIELGERCRRVVRVVLSIAHLDHAPEHNDPANLAALCQLCHLEHDRPHHQAEAAQTRAARRAAGPTLFPLTPEALRVEPQPDPPRAPERPA